MPKLTKSLAQTLKALQPYENDEAFMETLCQKGESPIEWLNARRLVIDIGELQTLGYLKVFQYNGKMDSFDLTPQGRDYHHNRVGEVVKAIGRYAFQLLVGASGGAVVLLLGKLLGQ